MLQVSSQFREHKSATSDEPRSHLEREINRLREMLAIDHTQEMTSAYLIELQAAVEAVGRAIKEERCAAKDTANSWANRLVHSQHDAQSHRWA